MDHATRTLVELLRPDTAPPDLPARFAEHAERWQPVADYARHRSADPFRRDDDRALWLTAAREAMALVKACGGRTPDDDDPSTDDPYVSAPGVLVEQMGMRFPELGAEGRELAHAFVGEADAALSRATDATTGTRPPSVATVRAAIRAARSALDAAAGAAPPDTDAAAELEHTRGCVRVFMDAARAYAARWPSDGEGPGAIRE
jgi:hypothetical protein